MLFSFTPLKARRLTGLAAVLVGLSATASAQTRVLFVGNSFTHGQYAPALNYNAAAITDVNFGLPSTNPRAHDAGMQDAFGGVPGIFKKFTTQAGLNYEVTIEAVSGKSLEFHHTSALSVIAQPGWDKVVLQEQSTRPTPTNRGGNRQLFYTYSTLLEQAIHGASPAAQVYLYGTWARPDFTYPAGSRYAGLPIDSMAQDLQKSFKQAFVTNGRYAAVAPVGDAWMRAITAGVAIRNPYTPDASKINLWASDQVHASKWGSYLSALVLFQQLTNVDPRTLGANEQAAADLGITPTDAVTLQQIAYQQVTSPTTATAKPAAAPEVAVFPNPATNQLTVQLGGLAGPVGTVRATLLNMLGQVVTEQRGSGSTLKVGLAGVAPGVYLLRLQTAVGVSSSRVEVKQ
ncbi:T9SS type A sorting domain-containing protein [Hymenobacter sp. UYP22]|uniref:T9SS type A sorting domain-containing protein n=1 Tax=Hymenobacter sp. UYP22 TaxID=3156348 RepID=UPI003398CDF7